MNAILAPVRAACKIRKQALSQLAGRGAMTVSEPIRYVKRAVSDPPVAGRRPRRTPQLGDTLMGMALLLGPANVIMQLARPGVGYGVMERRVESGRIDLHPIKRARTTFTYLVVAVAGSDA